MKQREHYLFFSLRYSSDEGYSIPHAGDSSFLPGDWEPASLLENPRLFVNLVHSEDRPAFLSEIGSALKTFGSYKGEFRIHIDGEDRSSELILSSRGHDAGSCVWDGFFSVYGKSDKKHDSGGRAEKLLQEVIRQSPVPIGVLDPQGSVMLYNRASAEVLGLEYDDDVENVKFFEMDNPWKFTDEKGDPITVDEVPIVQALKDKKHTRKEIYIDNPNGSKRWLMVDGAPILDDKGELIAGMTVFPDITRQKNSEIALQERIRELNCLYSISSLSEQKDLTLDELLNEVLHIILKTWNFPRMMSVLISYGEKIFESEIAAKAPDDPFFCQKSDIFVYGEKAGYIGVSYSGLRVTDDINLVNRELKMLNDMTARLGSIIEKKQSEEALRKSEAIFRRYVESAPDGMFLADEKGCYTDVNEAACRITGYDRDELIGMGISEIVYSEDREVALESFGRCVSEGRTSVVDRFVRKDGEIRYWSVDAVKLDDRNFLGFAKDVTEERKMEEQLRQMEKMDAIGQLAGGIAHDFNNQIAVIMGYSEMLVSKLKDPKLLKFAKNILAGAHRSDDLTRKLLAFAHKGLYERKAVNLHKVIGEAVDILTHSLDRKVALKLNLKASNPYTSGDPSQLQNILINLAINARDAMPDGGILTFSTENTKIDEEFCKNIPYEVFPGEFVALSVSDTGVGMSTDLMSRIFEPFFTTKKVGKGTGMGLASVYGAVSNHQAVIDVDSIPGEGTTFRLCFPVEKNVDTKRTLYNIPSAVRGNARIVLVDDEELIRSMGQEVLESLGYHVICFSDGQTALEYLSSNPGLSDLIILDMIMPGMSGKDVYRSIRDLDRGIPVLLSSGFSITGDVQQLLDEGAAAFVSKPYEIVSFSTAVSEALHQKKNKAAL